MIASGSSVPPPRPANPAPIRRERLGDAAHRAPAERGVAVEDREQRRDRRGRRRRGGSSSRSCHSRGRPRARRARRRPARRPGSRPGRRAPPSARRVRPERRDDRRRRAHVLAVAGRRDRALALRRGARAGAPDARSTCHRAGRASRAGARPGARRARRRGVSVPPPAVAAGASPVVIGRQAPAPVAVPDARWRSPWRSLTCSWTAVTASIIEANIGEVELLLGVGQRLVRVAGGPRP